MRANERARVALEGLSVGDAFGERFFGSTDVIVERIRSRQVPPPPWRYTDDTEMALSIVEQLETDGRIDQNALAVRFAKRMDVSRGYGAGAFEILSGIRLGRPWSSMSRNAFGGKGSFGNGSAMRVAPVGGYFADDLGRAVREASASAEVTHAHPEGIAGAVAVVVAAALCAEPRVVDPERFLDEVISQVPNGYTRDGLSEARRLASTDDVIVAAKTLGNGSGVSAPDTVPFCLWVVARHLNDSFENALWATVGALGDRDTTCAIVGGVLALRTGVDGIPGAWRAARETLPI